MFELEANLEAGEDSLGAVGGSFWVWLLLSRVPLCCGWKGNPKENRTPNRRHTLLGTGGKCECRGLPNFHMPWVRKIEPNSSSGRVPSLTKHTFSYYMGAPAQNGGFFLVSLKNRKGGRLQTRSRTCASRKLLQPRQLRQRGEPLCTQR